MLLPSAITFTAVGNLPKALEPAPVPPGRVLFGARTSVPILFFSCQHLSTEHLFNHRTLEDLAAGQVQFHILVRGQIHRKSDRIFLIIERHLGRLWRQQRRDANRTSQFRRQPSYHPNATAAVLIRMSPYWNGSSGVGSRSHRKRNRQRLATHDVPSKHRGNVLSTATWAYSK